MKNHSQAETGTGPEMSGRPELLLATTTGDLEAYTGSVGECVEAIASAGFGYLDLNLYSMAFPGSVLLGDDRFRFAEEAAEAAQKTGTSFIQSHAPDVNCFDSGEKLGTGKTAALNSVEVCGILGIKKLVVHSGHAPGVSKSDYFLINREFFLPLLTKAEKYGMKICIENSAEGNMGSRYFFFDAADMNEFIGFTGHPLLAACWDTGHANMRHMDQGVAIRELGANLAALHIQDNFGKTDDHIAPYQGTTDFIPILSALRDVRYSGAFTFEANNIISLPLGWPNSRPAMRPSKALRVEAEKLLFAIGTDLLREYERL